MKPDEMLALLNREGETCASEYDDSIDGWFGWQVNRDEGTITITFHPNDTSDKRDEPVTHEWFILYKGF
jgi:hypothetical protein